MISKYVVSREKGKLETTILFPHIVFSGLFFKMMPLIFKLMKQVILKGWKSLAFESNEKCDGCGICKRICPVNNIYMKEDKPKWNDHCAGCMACLHWCPKQAIQPGSINLKIKQYHHPEVELSDMLKQSKKFN